MLKKIPLSTIKIDQSFVSGIKAGSSDLSLLAAIINVAHSLDKPVIAEGIETEAHRDMLIELGCDIGQGYLFGRPLAVEDVLAMRWLDKGRRFF